MLVGLLLPPVKAPFRVDSVWFVHCHTLSSDSGDLNVIESLLVAIEHDTHAFFDDFASLIFSQIFLPSVLHEYLTVMGGKPSE